LNSLKNKIVFITGASSGIGKACAEHFGKQGANLIIAARRVDRITQLSKELQEKYSVKVLPLQLDISNKKYVKDTIGNLNSEWKNIDILINNAGVGVTTELMQNANPDDWDTIIDTNIKGVLYVTRNILPLMIERNSGHIVNIGSVAGHDYYIAGNL